MSESKYVATNTFAFGSVVLVIVLGTLIGVFGQTAQTIAIYMTIILAPVCVSLLIRLSVWLLNRICRHCRETLSAERDETAVCDIDPTTERLKSTVGTMRREEASCAVRYSQGRCSSDDLIRAKSLRIQAEIELLRKEAMPKSWAEVCQNVHAQT